MQYRREIDGLRALAVLPVILFHAGFQAFSGGFVGVDVFFVISGYLITSIIVAEREKGAFSIVGFYERRARRILPALFLVLFVCIPVAWWGLLPGDMVGFSQSVAAVTVFSSNVLFWLTSGYFDTAAELKPLLHTWSLGVEEQFYVFFPLFLMLAWRLRGRRLMALCLLVALLSLLIAQWASQARPDAAFYLLPTRAWELLLGALVALYLTDRSRKPPEGAWAGIAGAAGFGLILFATFAFDEKTPFPGLYALVPTVGTALIILCAGPGNFVGKLLAVPPLVGVGLISYSAYLWHQPLLAFAKLRSIEPPGPLLLGSLAAASLPLAWLTWRYVETPFRQRQRFTRRQIFTFGAVGSVLLAVFGMAGYFTEGFSSPFRYRDASPAELSLIEATLPSNLDHPQFDALKDKPFDAQDSRPRILLIGDSYAQDLTYALEETGLLRNVQMSTRRISRECGNLFVEQSRFIKHVVHSRLAECRRDRLYEDDLLRQRMKEADEIWLASAWQHWHVDHLEESLRNLREFSGKPVRVFGRKHFGVIHLNRLLALDERQRYAVRQALPAWHVEVNERMRQIVPRDMFIDVQSLLCGDGGAATCSPFTEDRFLKTFDGTHLTSAGARLYGRQLIERTPVGRFASLRSAGHARK